MLSHAREDASTWDPCLKEARARNEDRGRRAASLVNDFSVVSFIRRQKVLLPPTDQIDQDFRWAGGRRGGEEAAVLLDLSS